jgi:putative membrane protein
MSYELFRILHFLAIFVLVGALLVENMAIKKEISAEDARNLARVDSILGMSAIAVLLIGLVLWLLIGKPADFYTTNPVFQAKLALFVLIFLLSLYPTVYFFRNRKITEPSLIVPGAIILLLRAEIILMLPIPVLATLMARGIGLG